MYESRLYLSDYSSWNLSHCDVHLIKPTKKIVTQRKSDGITFPFTPKALMVKPKCLSNLLQFKLCQLSKQLFWDLKLCNFSLSTFRVKATACQLWKFLRKKRIKKLNEIFFISDVMIIVEIYDIHLSLLRLKVNKNSYKTLIDLKNVCGWRFLMNDFNRKHEALLEDKQIYLILVTILGWKHAKKITNLIEKPGRFVFVCVLVEHWVISIKILNKFSYEC